jgi:hypothetical protein
MFRGLVTMNDPCPVCGLVFQREEGYFLGAMYVSYLLSALLLGGFYFAVKSAFPGLSSAAAPLVALIPYLPLAPLVFRYSRVFWVHFERAADPNDLSAGAYEKHRWRQAARRRPPGRS